MKTNAKIFGETLNQDKKYNSLMDEIQRNKRMVIKFKIKEPLEVNQLWDFLKITFKKTFKIQRELETNLKFSSNSNNIHLNYEIEKYDLDSKTIKIKWNYENNKYWMMFQIKKKFLLNKYQLKITQDICKSSPFWGLQDTVGLFFMKRTFKKEMKTFFKSFLYAIENNLN